MEDSEAMAALWQKTDLITPMALRVAATLRLPDHIASGHTTTAELAAASGCKPEGLERLLRYLALQDVLIMEEDGELALGPVGACLRSDHPSGARGWFDLEGFGGRMSRCAFELLEAIRSGGPVWERLYGLGMWEELDANPALAESFNSLMATHSTALHPYVVDAYPWSDLRCVFDVGGGTGTLLAALAAGQPGLTGKVIDMPLAVEGARRRFAAGGLDGRLDAQEGDFFDGLPDGADAYLLSSVIHDWDDEPAAQILRRCAGRRIADWLRSNGHDVVEARELGPDPGDRALLDHAARERRILVTIDTDFGKLIHLYDVAHTGLVRLPDVPALRRIALIADLIERQEEALESGAIVTVRGERIRISRHPHSTGNAGPYGSAT